MLLVVINSGNNVKGTCTLRTVNVLTCCKPSTNCLVEDIDLGIRSFDA